jgi:hypothetical protein
MTATQTTLGRRALTAQMPPRSEKHKNFRRLAQARTDMVLEALRKLANLSSPNYEFDVHSAIDNTYTMEADTQAKVSCLKCLFIVKLRRAYPLHLQFIFGS